MCTISNLSAYVVKKGDSDAGVIFLHINKLNGNNLIYYQTRAVTGEIAWSRSIRNTPIEDKEAHDYLEKQKKYDPDLWILEIEDPEGKYVFDGIILQ
jgi:hypothetical protein